MYIPPFYAINKEIKLSDLVFFFLDLETRIRDIH